MPFDHHSMEYSREPWRVHAQLRNESPVAWTEAHGGFWVLNRADDIARVARDDVTFSARHDLENDGRSYTGITIPEAAAFLMPPAEVDPPETGFYRRLINRRLSPVAVARLESTVRRLTSWCLNRHVASGAIDLVLDLANPVAAMTTMHLMGLPLKQWRIWAEPLHASNSTPRGSPERAAAEQGMRLLGERLSATIESQRRGPKRGLIGDLLNARVDGQPLSDDILFGLCFIVIGGGVDTTTGLLAAAFDHLDRHPGDRRTLIEDPTRIPAAGEEFLRFFTPAPNNVRTATRDTEIGAIRIRKGERVLLCWGAANHDPEHFSEPDRVIIERFPNRHLAFGLGAHRCVGSTLARTMFRIVLQSVLESLPDYTLDRKHVALYEDRGHIAGYCRLPANFTPPRAGFRNRAARARGD